MDVIRVETNRTCPLRCRHCRCSTREDAGVVRAAPRAIARARESDFRSLVLSGGEPVLRPDLERLVAFAQHEPTIIIEGLRGEAKMKVKVTTSILEDVISVTHGWEGNANINYLTDDTQLDPIAAMPAFRTILCNIRRANS